MPSLVSTERNDRIAATLVEVIRATPEEFMAANYPSPNTTGHSDSKGTEI